MSSTRRSVLSVPTIDLLAPTAPATVVQATLATSETVRAPASSAVTICSCARRLVSAVASPPARPGQCRGGGAGCVGVGVVDVPLLSNHLALGLWRWSRLRSVTAPFRPDLSRRAVLRAAG